MSVAGIGFTEKRSTSFFTLSPKIKAVIKIFLGKCLCVSHYIKKWEHYAIAFIDNYCNNIIEVFGRIYGKKWENEKM